MKIRRASYIDTNNDVVYSNFHSIKIHDSLKQNRIECTFEIFMQRLQSLYRLESQISFLYKFARPLKRQITKIRRKLTDTFDTLRRVEMIE